MRSKISTSIAGLVFILLIMFASGLGWILNIIELAQTTGGDITGMFVLRIIGIFVAPLGAVLGYF